MMTRVEKSVGGGKTLGEKPYSTGHLERAMAAK
jgi:hypothetical protein